MCLLCVASLVTPRDAVCSVRAQRSHLSLESGNSAEESYSKILSPIAWEPEGEVRSCPCLSCPTRLHRPLIWPDVSCPTRLHFPLIWPDVSPSAAGAGLSVMRPPSRRGRSLRRGLVPPRARHSRVQNHRRLRHRTKTSRTHGSVTYSTCICSLHCAVPCGRAAPFELTVCAVVCVCVCVWCDVYAACACGVMCGVM